jgi:predicted nucleic acid-binding protein
MWLWDTNIVRAFIDASTKGFEEVRVQMDRVGDENIGLPITVAAELLDGRLRYLQEAYRRDPKHLIVAYERLGETIALLHTLLLVPFDEAALRVYQQRQRFPGTMSRGDRLIAAIALAGGHTLVTRNVAHFAGTEGLTVENWIDEPLT